MRRPSLLFLCHTVPYPPDGGVWIRTYNLLRELSKEFSLTILCFERALRSGAGHVHDEAASLAALRTLGEAEVFPIPQRHARARLVRDHLLSLVTARVYTDFLYQSTPFRQRVRQARKAGFDLVHVDSLDLSHYLPLLEGMPVALTHHNAESALLRRRATVDPSLAVRLYAALQSRFMEAMERRWCPRVALNVTVSSDDAEMLQRSAPRGRFLVVPNGVDVNSFHPAPERPGGGLVFVGGSTWFPNRDALDYFCREVLPLLRRERPELPVTWVGAAAEEERRRFQAEFNVTLTGYVEDIRPFVHAAECFIVPLRLGGGSRLKILDAWALGKAVVSTSVGAEGLEGENGGNILIADDAASFAAAVRRVLDDANLRRSLGRSARDLVERRYAWEQLGAVLSEAYLALVKDGRARRHP